jgi:WD40 repeat protein
MSNTVLDAPQLRDDYYCSLLAYSPTSRCLAVGLGNYVHLWSERKGVDTPESLNSLSTSSLSDVQHVTSLDFSSVQGGQSILAVGRADGRLALWSPFDSEPRFNAEQPKPISCVSFKPTIVKRPSLRDQAMIVPTEELLVGDEAGHIYFYLVEWPNETDSTLFGWNGALTLLARMSVHTQQICGLSWSTDGELFASGGNDNVCFLFETKKILQRHPSPSIGSNTIDMRRSPNGENVWTVNPGRDNNILAIGPDREKHRWELNAAVKAIAFCPWQRGLLAIGGGSNDRCIHFYHTISGACLATIDCAAQVTSLIWSTTRREIAATFGFAQPEHPFRIAVFAWPSCEQIIAIPWYDENRALYAIPYPGGPNTGRDRGEDGVWSSRGVEEGCIVVAASDAAIRFHEVWTEDRRNLGGGTGLLGGSDILESLHGIEKEADQTIR